MSRSNNTELVNPAKKFFEWQGSTGKIKAYNKELKENEFFDLPFTFIVLDRLTTITGYSDADQSGYWSNEIRSVKTEMLTVRTKNGIVAEGFYKDLSFILNKGASYAQSVYIGYMEGGVLTIGNIKLTGSSIGTWIDFCKGKKLYEIAVKITEATASKKGTTNFFIPTYVAASVSEDSNLKAIELDKELQEYLSEYFKRGGFNVEPKTDDHNAGFPTDEPPLGAPNFDDIPF